MTEPYGPYPPAQQPYGQPYPVVPREHPQGTLVLVLGILGIFVAGICAPFAWYIGSKALREMRAAGAHYSNEQSLVVGRILGLVMTVVLVIGVLFSVVFAIIVVITTVAGSR